MYVFEKVLIASRGEGAVRVARSCRRLGIETVGVFVDSERSAPHVEACDSAIRLGEDPFSYQTPELLLAALQESQADAVHPAYATLLHGAALASLIEEEGKRYVGPSSLRFAPAVDRLFVREMAKKTGVRMLDASERPIMEPNDALEDVDRIGYPVVVKPAVGLGDPVMVHDAQDVAALADALLAFGELDEIGGVYLETALERPRIVEVQVLCDGEHAVALGDREVSLRRGERRALCESPAPALDQLHESEAVRGALWDISVEIATQIACEGLTAARFLIDADGVFYFVGYSVGLSAEHAMTDLCIGLDLVELQLRLACAEPNLIDELSKKTEPTGASFCARIDSALDPRTGCAFESKVESARWPPAPQGKVRIDSGVGVGSAVGPEYDPLVATVTTYATTRHAALLMLDRVLAEIHLAPLVTNQRLLRHALNHESVRAGQYDAGLIERL